MFGIGWRVQLDDTVLWPFPSTGNILKLIYGLVVVVFDPQSLFFQWFSSAKGSQKNEGSFFLCLFSIFGMVFNHQVRYSSKLILYCFSRWRLFINSIKLPETMRALKTFSGNSVEFNCLPLDR